MGRTRKENYDEITAAHERDKLASEIYDLGYNEGKGTANNSTDLWTDPTWRAANPDLARWYDKWGTGDAMDNALNTNYLADKTKPAAGSAGGTAAGTSAGAASPTVADVAATPKELLSEDYLRQLADRREKGFSYDMNADYLYQLYKDQYMRQGKLAMEDTMGKAAAMTGGFGNTYAERTGQSTYNQYLQQLNDRVPELYQLALNKYQMEGDELKDMYSILANREAAANEEAWKQKEWDLTLQQFEFDKDKFGKEYALELAKQALNEKVANHDMSVEDAKLALQTLETQAGVDKTYADIDLGYKNFDEGVREFNDTSARGWADIGIAQQNANTSAYRAYNSGSTVSEEAAALGMTDAELEAYKAKFTGSVKLSDEKSWNAAVNKVASAIRTGSFDESMLYKYTYEQAVAIMERAESLINYTDTIKKGNQMK